MPELRLASILDDLDTTSVRELFQRNGSFNPSVYQQAQQAAIDSMYRRTGSFRGPFGFPLGEVEFSGQTAVRDFSGGRISFLSGEPQGERMTVVRVRYVGMHCLAESDHDQSSNSDEPYFIIGVASARGSRLLRFGPYKDVDKKENRYDATYLSSEHDDLTPPIVLGVVAIEHDHGNVDEATNKVRAVIEGLVSKFEQASGDFAGMDLGNHVMPEWARDILVGWVPEGIAALFGLADDEIGKTPVVLFDNRADLKTWEQLPILGKHGANEYNVAVNVDGGDEGNYNLYFKVDLFDVSRTFR